MTDVLEPAASGRAKCRGCGRAIAKETLRFGERGPNPRGDGEATYWFHLDCAAYRRPEQVSAVIGTAQLDRKQQDHLVALATEGIEHPRLPRLARAERDPSGRARCRHCRTLIDRGGWRLALEIWEEGRFGPIGSIHAACAQGYFGHDALLGRVRHFTSDLTEKDVTELEALLAMPPTPPAPRGPPPERGESPTMSEPSKHEELDVPTPPAHLKGGD